MNKKEDNNNDNNIINNNNIKKKKKISIHEEDNISIEYNEKDKSTKIKIYDFFGEEKDFTPRNINVIVEKLNKEKINSILLNKDSKDNLIRIPKNKKDIKVKEKSKDKIKIKKQSSPFNNIKKNKPNYQKIQKDKINKTKRVCEKFRNNPQLFYTEELCSLVIKSLDLDNDNDDEDNKENNRIVVNKIKKDNKIKSNEDNYNQKEFYMDELGVDPFSNLQKIIEESEEDNEKIK